ncbi:hypothetical protein GCM10010305_12410 [Streptomyces termitum]|uniref:LPXTG cell wall anchor domain-containing protein n=1 Tax=Streptomyces termitum TaxID=67368 RepID=A0A918W5U4_9ACTN|nr:hypothetical protein GCM10010305_12410 [Streptomyces termitum]
MTTPPVDCGYGDEGPDCETTPPVTTPPVTTPPVDCGYGDEGPDCETTPPVTTPPTDKPELPHTGTDDTALWAAGAVSAALIVGGAVLQLRGGRLVRSRRH